MLETVTVPLPLPAPLLLQTPSWMARMRFAQLHASRKEKHSDCQPQPGRRTTCNQPQLNWPLWMQTLLRLRR